MAVSALLDTVLPMMEKLVTSVPPTPLPSLLSMIIFDSETLRVLFSVMPFPVLLFMVPPLPAVAPTPVTVRPPEAPVLLRTIPALPPLFDEML